MRFTPPSIGYYRIALDGHGGATGNFAISVLSNDDRAGARIITGNSSLYANNTYASAEVGEPAHAGSPATHSLWYRFQSQQPGQRVAINTCSDFGTLDTVLAAYTEGAGGLVALASNDDDTLGCGFGGGGSAITFAAPAGPVYIAVDGKNGSTGAFTISTQVGPSNDDRAHALTLSPNGDFEYGETNLASKETGEPDHAANPGGHSVWYVLTPSRTGAVTADVCDAGFDTLLAVYTAGYGGLQEVASNDDASGCGTRSRLQFRAAAGVAYYVALDGKDGAAGWFELQSQPAPSNDDFAAATEFFSTVSGNTSFATAEPGEPAHAGSPAAHSLWYTVRTSSTAAQAVSTCSYSDATTKIAVYEGATLTALAPVASGGPGSGCASGNGARVSWRPPDSTSRVYRVAVDQAGAASASFTLSRESLPLNDQRADAQYLFESSDSFGTTAFATHELGEPDHAGAGGASSVWYRWQPGRSARARLTTCGTSSGNDTILAVYTLAGTALTQVGVNDDTSACDNGRQSLVDFDAIANTVYWVAVDARAGQQGTFVVKARLRPVNDNRADAVSVTGDYASYTNLDLATKEPGEPDHAGQPGGHSVWYRWTASTSGPTVIDTCSYGGGLDSLLAVYTTGYGGLQEVASNDDTAGCGAGGRGSRVQFGAAAGIEYLVAVDAKGSTDGYLYVGFPPANDAFASPYSQSAASFAYSGELTRATAEPGEPAHGGAAADRSVWFRWTPPRSGQATIDSCNYTATRVAAYTGASLASLAAVTPRPRSTCPAGQVGSRLRFEAVAGTTYRLAVDGSSTSTYYYVQVNLAPANDAFANAASLGEGTSQGSSASAGLEDGEQNHAGSGGAASVWYRWTAPRSATLRADTCSSSTAFDTAIALYTQQGSGVAGLQQLAANDDTPACGASGRGSRVRLHVDSGTTYWLAVTGHGDVEGSFDLQLALGPFNDDFANAATVGLGATAATTTDAGQQAGEPDHAGVGGTATAWFRWTAPRSATLRADTCTYAEFDTALALYTQSGTGLAGLQQIAANDDAAGCGIGGRSSRIRVHVDAGTSYWIAVTGRGEAQGAFYLQLGLGPVNDDFANAAALPEGATAGTTLDAGDQPSEPDHGVLGGDRSVWYRFTASDSRNLELRACPVGAAPTPVVALYTGTALGFLTPTGTASSRSIGGVTCRVSALRGVNGPFYAAVDGAAAGQEGSFVLTLAIAAANDDRSRAQSVSGSGLVGGTTFAATAEDGEPAHAGVNGGRSVWFRWTPAQTGPVLIDTCSSSLDTLLAVYLPAAGGALDPVASSDNGAGCVSGASRVIFTANAGSEYLIAVDGKAGVEGSFQLGFPPPNDLLAAATAISGELVSRTGTLDRAIAEPGEPAHAGSAAARSVWYSWTPSRSGRVEVSTCLGSTVATRVAMYTGSAPAALTAVSSSGPTPGCAAGQGALTRPRVIGGTTYRIAVDGVADGTFTLQVALAPVNDDRADAIAVALRDVVSGTTAFATSEDGEPSRAGRPADASVWYRFDSGADGPVTLKTCSSSFSTVLGVYDESVAAFHEVASSDDSPGRCANRAALTFQATAGARYLIAVDRRAAGASGAFELTVGSPANDDMQDAAPLSGLHASGAGNTGATTAQDAEPSDLVPFGRRTAWWTWTAPSSGSIEINTCGSSYQPNLAVYHGTIGSLTRDAVNSSSSGCASRSRVTLTAVAGRAYLIAVAGSGTGAVRIQIGPPANDRFAAPEALTGEDDDATGTLAGASAEDSEPAHGAAGSRRTLWYTWTAPANGLLTLDSCGSPTPVYIAAYSGSSLGSLIALPEEASPDACDAESPGHTETYQVDIGAAYRIALEGSEDSTGPTALRLRLNVDNDPPETTIDEGPPSLTRAAEQRFAFSADEEDSTFECRLGATPFANCTPPVVETGLADGAYVFEVRATDRAGNVDPEPATRSFTIDRTPPGVTITDGPPAFTSDASPRLEFSSNDATATLRCALDDAEPASCASPVILAAIADSEHTWLVEATDPAGNLSRATRTFTVDTIGPNTTFGTSPRDPTNAPVPSYAFSSEPGATYVCSLDAAAYAACESPLELPGLGEGDHVFRVLATDRAGNVETEAAEHIFEIDRTPPDTTIISQPSGPFHEGEGFEFVSTEDGGFECRIDDLPYEYCLINEVIDLIGVPPASTRSVSARSMQPGTPIRRRRPRCSSPPTRHRSPASA